jgi:hypothetical protein
MIAAVDTLTRLLTLAQDRGAADGEAQNALGAALKMARKGNLRIVVSSGVGAEEMRMRDQALALARENTTRLLGEIDALRVRCARSDEACARLKADKSQLEAQVAALNSQLAVAATSAESRSPNSGAPRGMVIRAQFEGRCRGCRRKLNVDDCVWFRPGSGCLCMGCHEAQKGAA